MKNDAVQEMVVVKDLVHAEWNPRTVEELAPEHPAMSDLVASVKALGVIQPVVVWIRDIDGVRQNTVIAGNRRAEAARIAGIERIPALVYAYYELTIDEAQSITRSENEVRLGVDPILDSQLITRMLDQGLSQQEIAAKLGTSEATVCRRVKLGGLSEDFIKLYRENSDRVSVKALEAIAAHGDLQESLFKDLQYQARGGIVSHAAVMQKIRGLTQKLCADDWMFKSPIGSDLFQNCKHCAHNTSNQADLFAGDFTDEADASRCECASCFKKMCERARDAIIREKVGDGVEIEMVRNEWDIPKYGGKRSKKNCVAWVAWSDWNHEISKIRWAPSKKELEAENRRRKEDEKAKSKLENDARDRMLKARGKLDVPFDYDNRKTTIDALRDTVLCVFGSDEQANAISDAIMTACSAYSYSVEDWKLNLLKVFPKFAECVGVTQENIEEYESAQKALDELRN